MAAYGAVVMAGAWDVPELPMALAIGARLVAPRAIGAGTRAVWEGSATELAQKVGWPWSARALAAAMPAMAAQQGYEFERTGGTLAAGHCGSSEAQVSLNI